MKYTGIAFGSGSHLSKGYYDMYVLADGAPVEVSLKVNGLEGKASFETTPVDAEIKTLAPKVEASQGPQLYSAGAFTELRESDWSFMGLWALERNEAATAFGSCAYTDEPDGVNPPEPSAFLPGCPLSDGFTWANPGPNNGTIFTLSDHGGPEGIGGWFTAANSHARYGAVAFWVDL